MPAESPLTTSNVERVRRLKRVEWDRIVASGVFAEDERLELIRGLVVTMTPPGIEHGYSIDALVMILAPALKGRAFVRVQSPFAATDDSQPQPDLMVMPPEMHQTVAQPAVAWLVIEVANSSLRDDRRDKLEIYAEAGVPEYWIIDLVHGQVDRYLDPRDGDYQRRSTHRRGETIAPERFPDVRVPVDEILPPPAP
jgi:Uma2 family endonuclease